MDLRSFDSIRYFIPQKLYQEDIKMAMGTDMQINPEMGTNAYELEIYINYGMLPI